MDLENKICGECKEYLPKTKEYFFTKTYKQKNAKGIIYSYTCFRSTCKSCHSIIIKRTARKRRCKKMGWNIENYEHEVSKNMSMLKLKHKELYGLSQGVINGLRKKIDEGYVFTTYEQHKIDCGINISMARRKYQYYNVGELANKKLRQRCGIINLTDAYIANTLGFNVKDVPKNMIETKRLYLQLKRELGETKFKNK